MPARSPPVPARFRLDCGSVPGGAGSLLAWLPPLPARCRLGSRWCWLGAGSVPADAGSVPVPQWHSLFTQIKYHRLPRYQSALTPVNSYCIQAMPLIPGSHHYLGPYVCINAQSSCSISKRQSAHHNDWMSFRRVLGSAPSNRLFPKFDTCKCF